MTLDLLVQYCLNKTWRQCQNGTFGEFYQYLWWVLTFELLFKVRSVSTTCLSVHPISPILYIWLTSNHHCIFTMPSTCTSHYYSGSLTLAWWPWPWLCLLLQNYLNQISHQYQNGTFAAFCQYLRWVWKAVTFVDLCPTFQCQIDLLQYYLNQTSHLCYKGEHVVNLANILYKF